MNTISFAALDEWLSRQPELIQEHAFFEEADAFEDIGVQFHTGDWTGEVLTAAPVTVIDGNVTVGKISWDYDLGLLLITGDLHCEHIGRLGIDLVVGGKLIAKTLCLNTLNDHALIVGGDIRSDYLAEFGCYVKAQGQIICPKVLALMNDIVADGGVQGELIKGLRGEAVAQVLIPEALTADGFFDEDKFSALVRAGRSPFKA